MRAKRRGRDRDRDRIAPVLAIADLGAYHLPPAAVTAIRARLGSKITKQVLPALNLLTATYLFASWRARVADASDPNLSFRTRGERIEVLALTLADELEGTVDEPRTRSELEWQTTALYGQKLPSGVSPANVAQVIRAVAHVGRQMQGAGRRRPGNQRDQHRWYLELGVGLTLERAGVKVKTEPDTNFSAVLGQIFDVVGIKVPYTYDRIIRRVQQPIRKYTWVPADVEHWIAGHREDHAWKARITQQFSRTQIPPSNS